MNESDRLQKLSRVLEFYRDELKLKQLELNQAHKMLLEQEAWVVELSHQLDAEEKKLGTFDHSITQLQLGGFWLDQLQQQLAQQQQRVVESHQQFVRRQHEVREQMSKIESFEKLVQRRTEAMDETRRRSNQVASDDRFLSTEKNEVQG